MKLCLDTNDHPAFDHPDDGATMPELNGFLPPKTPTGKSAIVPNMPWYYSGTLLTVEYRTDPANVKALLPEGLELADEDPGAVAVR